MLENYSHTPVTRHRPGNLLFEKLGEALWAEQALVEILPSLAKSSFSMELTSTFDLYAAQTEEHIARLDKIFKTIDQMPQKRPTELSTLLAGARKVMEDHENPSPASDVALVIAAKRITSYQIAFYEWLWTMAQNSSFPEIRDLIQNIINQEKERQHILFKLEKSLKSAKTDA